MPYINNPLDFYWHVGSPLLGAVACESHWIGTMQLLLQGCQCVPSLCHAFEKHKNLFLSSPFTAFIQLIGKLLSRASHQWDSYFFQANVQAWKLTSGIAVQHEPQCSALTPSLSLQQVFCSPATTRLLCLPILKTQTDFASLPRASWIISLFLFLMNTSVFSDCISL